MTNMKLFPIYDINVVRDNGRKEHICTANEADAINCVSYWIDEDDVIEVNIRGRLRRREDDDKERLASL